MEKDKQSGIKRDSDSMDDFEHVVKSSVLDETVTSDGADILNATSVQLIDVPRAPKDLIEAATKLERNLLDTTVADSLENSILQPVPATPPPSADIEKFDMGANAQTDPFARLQDLSRDRADPVDVTMAFMATERGFPQDTPAAGFPGGNMKKFGDLDEKNETSEKIDKVQEDLLHDFDKPDPVFQEVKSAVLPAPEKSPVVDILADSGRNHSVNNDFLKFTENVAPTKPLPPLPRDDEKAEDKFQMTHDFMSSEIKSMAKHSGNETGDSEFESEPEPSPAKTAVQPAAGVVKKPEERPNPVRQVRHDHEEIAPKTIFTDMGLVADLIYWRQPEKTGAVFGAVLAVLISLAYFSLISVFSYTGLFVVIGTMSFRIYKTIMQAVQKTSDGHPFKDILEVDLTLPAEKVHEVADVAVAHANAAVSELRRLFFVEDFIDSIKFTVVLWSMTYLGSVFNGMTLIIIGVVALFTLPKVYETNKAQIDQNLALVQGKVNELTAKVKAAIPLGKKAEPTKEE